MQGSHSTRLTYICSASVSCWSQLLNDCLACIQRGHSQALQRCAVHAVVCVSHVICFVCCAMLELWHRAALHEYATRCYVGRCHLHRAMLLPPASIQASPRLAVFCAADQQDVGPAGSCTADSHGVKRTATVWYSVEHELTGLFDRQTCRSQTPPR
jgi:hypothetical protein